MFNAESLIRYGGLLIVFLAVYGQTGLFFCFFLPSGALMFTAGVFAASGALDYNIITINSLLVVAAILGNITGYWFGHKAGPVLYRRKDSKFFKRKHLETAGSFYKKYGGVALAAGLFLPIVRTFSPIVAGIINVRFWRFFAYVFIGSMAWVLSFVLAGYFIGSMPLLKPYLKYIIIAIIVLVTTPIVLRVIKEFKTGQKGKL